ncbi:hypothetical protein [Hymenobacter sp.]|uniref:hypothetical protein n=1 Tax=Hymenobacter sp. TaxID=1898978 RepID=UPI00286C0675|nr:hypothetical protein [Hymenobacter sp.]
MGSGSFSIGRFNDFTRELTGNATITAYDAKRQLVTGSYEVPAPEQNEPPKAGLSTDPNCTIILAGTFKNLRAKTQ